MPIAGQNHNIAKPIVRLPSDLAVLVAEGCCADRQSGYGWVGPIIPRDSNSTTASSDISPSAIPFMITYGSMMDSLKRKRYRRRSPFLCRMLPLGASQKRFRCLM
jgi:hypothetical protein